MKSSVCNETLYIRDNYEYLRNQGNTNNTIEENLNHISYELLCDNSTFNTDSQI